MNFLWYKDIYELILIQGWEKYFLIPEKAFAGISVMTVADLLQPPPAREKVKFPWFFDKDSMKRL